MKFSTAITTAVLSAVAFAASAQTPATPRIDARQARQEGRIDQGVSSGALTTREARMLQARQNHIAQVESRAKADGVVTPHEAGKIAHKQNKASRQIKRQKHDRQVAVGR